jgi:N6-adenosine-specific RNA methylase IME4
MKEIIIKEKWYKNLVEECRAIITESIFSSRWALIEGYWKLGERLRNENNFKRKDIYGKKIVQGLAQSIGISTRTIHYALQAYDKFPTLDDIPEGKNISWNKLINLYLPAPKDNKIELPIPQGKYGLIIIDPPWKYGTEYNSETRRSASPYQELSQEELKNLIIPSADNCVLWLWTTHKFIWDAKELLTHWGFEYKLTLVWNKEKLGMGEWLRCQAEFCLLGIKGKPAWNLTNERDILTESRREHSRKPDSFYKMIQKLTPVKGLDMFGREKRKGFDVWGNEPDKF